MSFTTDDLHRRKLSDLAADQEYSDRDIDRQKKTNKNRRGF